MIEFTNKKVSVIFFESFSLRFQYIPYSSCKHLEMRYLCTLFKPKRMKGFFVVTYILHAYEPKEFEATTVSMETLAAAEAFVWNGGEKTFFFESEQKRAKVRRVKGPFFSSLKNPFQERHPRRRKCGYQLLSEGEEKEGSFF